MSHTQGPLPEEGRASPRADAGPMRGPESRHRRAVDERRHEIGHQVPEMHGTPPFSRMGSAKILASPRKWSNPPVVSLRRELTGRQTNFPRV